jgi:phosphomannomutase
MDPSLAAEVRAWIQDDPDPAARAELENLLAAGDEPELRDRFRAPLSFGTAGLRGPLRAGPNGMNRAVVARAAAGLACHLGSGRTVVIGYDARHGSRRFAHDSAAVLAGAGLKALVLPRALPTPILAFAVRRLEADAGIMVTASHNPPTDNGYKVFLGGPDHAGAQLVAPVDREIEARMRDVGSLRDLLLGEPLDEPAEEVIDAYADATAALTLTGHRDVRIAYTPLHGVGRDTLLGVFARAGFPPPAVVAAQAEPDPRFPTVSFPNPEEPGAMERVMKLARKEGAHVAIAHDPDADRCAVAVNGRRLTGDELGVLLADHLLTCRRGLVATTVVSSSMLAKLAAAHDVPYAETLTGSSGSCGPAPGSSSAMRKRWVMAWAPTSCATRTASPPRCSWPSWLPACAAGAPPCSTASTSWPASTASTSPTSTRCAPRTTAGLPRAWRGCGRSGHASWPAGA